MSSVINKEIENLNIDILVKLGIKKSTINKLHKLKAKKLVDLGAIEAATLEELLAENENISAENLREILSADLIEFTRQIFAALHVDPSYEIVMLHLNNHTHHEIAKRIDSSKDKVKQDISKFFQVLYTLVDALGNKLIGDKNYISMEDLHAVLDDEEDFKVLLLAFKTHDTKWIFNNKTECITSSGKGF